MFITLAIMVLVAAVAAVGIAIFLRRVVPTNMVHIVQSSRHTTPYGRGKSAGNTYYAWPAWVPVLGVSVIEFPESIFQVSLKDYEAYDQARLPFMVDVTAFFRVDAAEVAAQRVASFSELSRDLQAVLQGAVRRILATNTLESIMQSRSELGDQFTSEVESQIKEWGVLPVKTIEFMDLRDTSRSEVIANIMAKEKSRIEMESRQRVAENHRTAELAEINARREVEVQRQDAEQQVGLRTAQKEQVVGIAKEQAEQEIKTAAKTTAERDMDVKKVQEVRAAEITRDVAAVKAEQDKKVAVVNAEAQKEVQVVQAEAAKTATETRAAGDLTAALKDADGIKARGEARAAAETAMLMAPVESQIKLAAEIGSNDGYQKYLVTIEQIRAGKDVGIKMAESLGKADLKVIANSGDVHQGMAKLGDMLTPAGGTNLAGMLSALAQSPEGKALVAGVTQRLAGPASATE